MDDAEGSSPRTSRPLDVACGSCLHAVKAREEGDRGPPAALGDAVTRRTSHALPGAAGIFVTVAGPGNTG